jgi:hypothetical protein
MVRSEPRFGRCRLRELLHAVWRSWRQRHLRRLHYRQAQRYDRQCQLALFGAGGAGQLVWRGPGYRTVERRNVQRRLRCLHVAGPYDRTWNVGIRRSAGDSPPNTKPHDQHGSERDHHVCVVCVLCARGVDRVGQQVELRRQGRRDHAVRQRSNCNPHSVNGRNRAQQCQGDGPQRRE